MIPSHPINIYTVKMLEVKTISTKLFFDDALLVDGPGGDALHLRVLSSGLLDGVGVGVLAAALLVDGSLAAVPLAAGDGVDAEDVHGVDLLEGTVLGLDDEEEDEGSKEQARATEDHAVPVVDVVDDEGGEERDEEVLNVMLASSLMM